MNAATYHVPLRDRILECLSHGKPMDATQIRTRLRSSKTATATTLRRLEERKLVRCLKKGTSHHPSLWTLREWNPAIPPPRPSPLASLHPMPITKH